MMLNTKELVARTDILSFQNPGYGQWNIRMFDKEGTRGILVNTWALIKRFH